MSASSGTTLHAPVIHTDSPRTPKTAPRTLAVLGVAMLCLMVVLPAASATPGVYSREEATHDGQPETCYYLHVENGQPDRQLFCILQ